MRFILFFLLLFTHLHSEALEGKYELKGVLVLNTKKKEIVSYALEIDISKYNVKGFAITDPGGKNETKNEIIGTIDPKHRTLKLNERNIVYTKSKEPRANFCYVSLLGKYKSLKGSLEVSGEFNSQYETKESCLSGTFQLINTEKLEVLTEKGDKMIQKDKSIPDSIKSKYNLARIADSLTSNYLRKDEAIKFFIKNSEIVLTIFDHDKEDGDQISLHLNGKELLPSIILESRKKDYKIHLKNETNIIKIKALNEGYSAPNTGTLIFKENNVEMVLKSYLRIGESAEIIVIKTKE